MKKEHLLKSLKAQGFPKKVLDAFSAVKREEFMPVELERDAYRDTAMPIGSGQTISQPYTIAVMLSELDLKPGQKVLEAGSGSGYAAALISEIVGEQGKVIGLEIIKELAKRSKDNLIDYENVEIFNKNAAQGMPEEAPFDRILMSAGCREIPKKLLNQLKDGGILVTPKGSRFEQKITVVQRKGDKFVTKKEIPGFIFVPFVGG